MEKQKSSKLFPFQQKKKFIKVDKVGNESIVTISYKIKFIDSARFMASLLSNLLDNPIERTHIIKRKDCNCFLEHESVTDNLIMLIFR